VKPWISIAICISIFAVLSGVIAGYHYVDYRIKEQRSHDWTVFLVSCKTDDLNVETFASHYLINYPDDSRDYLKKMQAEITTILESNPDSKLFHYNTPEKIWRQLGGRKGYAILLNSRIVWERKMKYS
jgi:hypothetical protein